MSKMTLTPELTEALCGFCGDVSMMENNVDLISSENNVDLISSVEDHLIDEETNEPAKVLDTLKSLRSLKRDMTDILKAMRKAERV